MSNPVDAAATDAVAAPTDAVMDLIFGRWRSQTLYVGVKLGIFEVLADGPHSAEEVAETQGLDPDNTYRLLRALGSLDLLDERPGGTFEITEKGKLLTRNHPRSLRGVVLLEEGPEHYASWTHLPDLIRSGEEEAFEEEHGHSVFEYGETNPEYGRVCNKAMSSYSRMETEAVLTALSEKDLSGVSHLCDVGGGHGHLLCHLLKEYSNRTGEVLELPEVVEEAGDLPEEVGVEDRITFTPGDMFEAVPEADGYLMKHVLHDWSDEECVEILENIQEAGPPGSPVFVAEWVVPGPKTAHFAKLMDLHMLVNTGGRERTVEEYGELFDRAGMELAAHHEAGDAPLSVVEGRTT